jgi:site-specific DNA-methyltransferase (adenine-specific)/adenine-specific DNA-methyltransferase
MPSLNWIGKEAVENHHQQVPFHLLKDVPDLACGEPGDGNLIVEGDNLVALKALLPYYAGQVKCIYIDPPYNTGNEGWAYNDNVNSPVIREWLGKVVGKEGETLDRHDRWLCMMYPRLTLLRRLLREDGVIFISIDDDEVVNLRFIADEIFGHENFIANVVWQKKQSPQNDAINISDMHDHILVYAKRAKQDRSDPNGWQRNLITRSVEQNRRYTNPDNDSRGPWTSADATVNKTADERPNLYYAVINPNTAKEVWPSRRRTWLFEKSVFDKLMNDGRIWWGTKGGNFPRLKKYLAETTEGVVPSTWWTREVAGDNQESRRELRRIFDDMAEDAFSTPKPTRLIERILQIATNPGDLILDSFAGSGTTGHAVLRLNHAAPDQEPRRFILVEMEPKIARDVTAERVRRVAEGYKNAKGERVEGLGGGFRYCELGEPLFDERGKIRETVSFADLARHVYFTETGEPLPRGRVTKSPFLGSCRGVGIYLLYNGILSDKSVAGGNVLTSVTLAHLPPYNGHKIVYGAGCRLSRARLVREGITFKQTPYTIKTS